MRTQEVQLELDTARVWAQLNFLYPAGDSTAHPPAATATPIVAPALEESK